jgi:hypothetical protein
MKDHGVAYPTLNQWYSEADPDNPALKLALTLRNKTGLPTDKIYLLDFLTGNSTDSTVLSKLERDVTGWKRITSQYGYQNIYVYGKDEAAGDVLRSERTAWQTVHKAGGKVYAAVAGNTGAVTVVGDLLDVAVFAGPLNATQAALWHNNGKKIFSYANPQAGVEDPLMYRRNYGFALWNAGYDGTMNFPYQHNYGQSIWNDFDSASTHFRDHVFAYPTSDGVIDTIEWEGWREGVDDTRYLASLKKHEGNYTSGKAIIAVSLSKGEDMAIIRKKVVEQILSSHNPSITVTSPNSGVSWTRGSSHIINWSSSGDVGTNVKMEVLKAGVVVQTLSSSTPNDGTYSWTISTGLITGSDYRIRITSTTNAAISNTSSIPFAITMANPAPSIKVITPDGAESWIRGSSHTINWSSSGDVGANVKMEVLKAGVVVQTLSSSTPNDGTYSWTISTGLSTGSDYRIRITSTTNAAISNTSSIPFAITMANPAPSIQVITPDGGEMWKRGTTRTVTWDYTGDLGSTVKITRLQGGVEAGTISSGTPLGTGGHGSFVWNIDSTGSTGSNCQVKIQSIRQPGINDVSNNYFTLTL